MNAWVLLDERFAADLADLSDGAFRLHIEAICWCARNLTGLTVPLADLPLVGRSDLAVVYVDELVKCGVWVSTDDGWEIRTDPMWTVKRAGFRRPISQEIRLAVYARDGNKCALCGSTDDLSLDHIRPWSKFGSDHIDNLRTLCQPCNSHKGARG